MSQDSSFWSIKLLPGQSYKINIPESTELKLTNACIVPKTPPLPSSGVSLASNPMFRPPLSLIRLCIQSNSNYNSNTDLINLATFVPGKIEHQILQFVIRSDRFGSNTLHNISSGTAGEIIHVCGKLSVVEYFDEYEEDEDNSNQDDTDNDDNDNDSTNNRHHDIRRYNFGGNESLRAYGL